MQAIRIVFSIWAAILINIALPYQAFGQQIEEPPFEVRGIYNWIHSTGDGEISFPFYRDILGIKLVRSPFGGPVAEDTPPPQIRPASEARSDPLIWNLTDTEGSRFRNIFMHTDNTPFGLELSEFFDISRNEKAPNPWDPGASRLIFHVRNLDTVLASLEAAEATVITSGGEALNTPDGLSILVQDPDGYLIQITQASATEIAGASSPDQIVSTAIGLTVADTAASLQFYQELLGFDVRGTRQGTSIELQLNGLSDGQLTRTRMLLPGTAVIVMLDEFIFPTGSPVVSPVDWRIQDVGSPQFQLQVTDLDVLIEKTQQAGYRFLSIGAEPIQRAFGRFVFAIDPDGVLVEFVEPTTQL